MREKDDLDFEIRFYERLVAEKPDFLDALIPLAEVYTRKGFHEKGLEIDRRLAELCRTDPVVHYNLACSLSLTGQNKEAIRALKRAVRLGYRDFTYLRRDPDLKGLQGDPEFQTIFSRRK